jgi:hypothetical protein
MLLVILNEHKLFTDKFVSIERKIPCGLVLIKTVKNSNVVFNITFLKTLLKCY